MLTTELVASYSPLKYPFSLPRQPHPCCYFLCSEAEVKYVGQTVRLPSRLGDHAASKPPFDEVFYIPTPARKLTKIESRLIAEIDPPWNGGIGGDQTLTLNKAAWAKMGIPIDDVAGHITMSPHSAREKDANRIHNLESALSMAQDLLREAIRRDSFAIVENTRDYLGTVLSGSAQASRR